MKCDISICDGEAVKYYKRTGSVRIVKRCMEHEYGRFWIKNEIYKEISEIEGKLEIIAGAGAADLYRDMIKRYNEVLNLLD